MSDSKIELVKQRVRNVPDFPKPGIMFKDITPVLSDPTAFNICLDLFAERYDAEKLDAIVGIESRGFIFGAALAARMRKAFVPARKPGKLPAEKLRVDYQLEYGSDAIEMHKDALTSGERVLILDDLLATGGTAGATCELVQKLGAHVIGAAFVIELSFLPGRKRLAPLDVFSLIQY